MSVEGEGGEMRLHRTVWPIEGRYGQRKRHQGGLQGF